MYIDVNGNPSFLILVMFLPSFKVGSLPFLNVVMIYLVQYFWVRRAGVIGEVEIPCRPEKTMEGGYK